MRRLRLHSLFVVALVGVMGTSLSCKLQLTPESISRTWTAFKNARKNLTPENEYYIGRSLATTLLAKNQYDYVDKQNMLNGQLTGLTKYVNQVGAVLAVAALETPRKGDRPTPIGGWHFIVMRDAKINAFAAPGGFILVTTGAIKAAKSEDELAAVLAHEIAHVMRGHALGSIKKSRWAGVYKEFLDSSVQLDQQTLGKLTKVFEGSMNDMVDAMTVKGYSRDTEYEADRVGLAIMARAGYDPRAFTRYLRTLKAQQHTGKGGFYATHPKASDRIKKLKKRLKKYKGKEVTRTRRRRFGEAVSLLDRQPEGGESNGHEGDGNQGDGNQGQGNEGQGNEGQGNQGDDETGAEPAGPVAPY